MPQIRKFAEDRGGCAASFRIPLTIGALALNAQLRALIRSAKVLLV
jgi:hypothetical protein